MGVPAGRALVIINPSASRGRGARAWARVRDLVTSHGLSFTEVFSERPRHAWEIAGDAATQGYSTVVAAGGDGTVNEVINGLMQIPQEMRPALAVIPGGTGNDFARGIGTPKRAPLAVQALLNGVRKRVDVGQVNGRYFAGISGVGFDAEAARQANAWPRWIGGTALYVAAILKMLVTYSPVEARITIDGRPQTLRMFLLAAANTKWYGGGMLMAPHAEIDDGRLGIVYARDLGKLETLMLLPKVYTGKHLQHPKVSHTTATEVVVESDVPLSIHADGETVGRVPARFRSVPGALEVLVPQGLGLRPWVFGRREEVSQSPP